MLGTQIAAQQAGDLVARMRRDIDKLTDEEPLALEHEENEMMRPLLVE